VVEMKILPLGKSSYREYPVTDKNGNFLDGVIEITPEEFAGIQARTHGFSDDLKRVVLILLPY